MLKKSLLLLSIIFSFITISLAQDPLSLYYMNSIPQVNNLNPAMLPSSKVNLGLPIMSGIYLNLSNSGFGYNDVITKRTDDSLSLDMNNLVSKLKSKNFLNANLNVDLLNLSFKAGKNFIGISVNEKMRANLTYPQALFKLINEGNGKSLLGERADFDGLGLNFSHYREYSLTYAREFLENKLTIGARAKYLNGFENISTTSKLGLSSDPTTFDLTIDGGLTVNSSGINRLANGKIDPMTYVTNKNKGAAIDLGANYQLNNKLSFSAALKDLGYINWKEDIKNIKNDDFNFKYTGIDLTEMLNGDSNIVNNLIDSITNTAKGKENSDVYKKYLNPQIILGGAYHLNDKNSAGLLVSSELINKTILPGFCISYNTRLKNFISASLSYSMLNRSYNNIGAGISLNFWAFQIYFVSDNILPIFQLAEITPKGSDKAIPIPYKAQNLNLRFGINFTMGRPKNGKDKDKDGIVDKKDECPDQAGIIALKGCPDKDGDGLTDKKDNCPDIKGSIELGGCPDKDNDGIADSEDQCPEEKGLKATKGCPDNDGDEVANKEDKCPELKGTVSNKGCPEVKVHLIKEDSTILKTVMKDTNGTFNFDSLLANQNYLFKLEKDNDSLSDITVSVGKEIKKAKRTNSGLYLLENKIDSIIIKTDTIEVKEVEIKLEKADEEILKRVFSHLEFDSGKDVILQSSFSYLQELTDLMSKHLQWRIKLSGHTDDSGTPEANLTLSKKRVESVKNALSVLGIDQNRIVLKWHGSSVPITVNDSEEGRQKNRRVEMTIIE